MEENKKNQPQFQIQLKPEVAGGQYANFALITHSKTEFVIDFAQLLPGMPGGQVCSRIIQAPEHAKRLLAALQENIYKYEQQFGKIEITDQPPRSPRGWARLDRKRPPYTDGRPNTLDVFRVEENMEL